MLRALTELSPKMTVKCYIYTLCFDSVHCHELVKVDKNSLFAISDVGTSTLQIADTFLK